MKAGMNVIRCNMSHGDHEDTRMAGQDVKSELFGQGTCSFGSKALMLRFAAGSS